MSIIDTRVGQMTSDRHAAERDRAARHGRLVDCATQLQQRLKSDIAASSYGWALRVAIDRAAPSLKIERSDKRIKVLEIVLSESRGRATASLSGSGQYDSDLPIADVQARVADAVARSIVDDPLGMHPAIKWSLLVIGGAIALVFLAQVVIAIAYAVGVAIVIILGAIFVAGILTGG